MDIFKHLIIAVLFISTSCTLSSMSSPELGVEKSYIIEVFDTVDGPLTKSIIELITKGIKENGDNSSNIENAVIQLDSNSCSIKKTIMSSRNHKYSTDFSFNSLIIDNKDYESVSGSMLIEDDCSSDTLTNSSIKADFQLKGHGYITEISFLFNNHGISNVTINNNSKTEMLKNYFETQSAKYINITKNILSTY